MIRNVSDLYLLSTFKERYEYLRLDGIVGKETFGFDRYFNQRFYKSIEWKKLRDEVIIRDNGCDLGVDGYDIYGRIIIHHLNPISIKDIENQTDLLLNPEFLICTTHKTHQAIHYGSIDILPSEPIERTPGDTVPWKIGERNFL